MSDITDPLFEDAKKATRGRGDYSGKQLKNAVLTAKYSLNKKPQAVFKIYSFCQGKAHARSHLLYLTRVYEDEPKQHIELEDENGNVITGKANIKQAVKELVDEWSVDFEPEGTAQPPKLKIKLAVPKNQTPAQFRARINDYLHKHCGAYDTRVDKGRSKNTANNFYITISDPQNCVLPEIESFKDSIDQAFDVKLEPENKSEKKQAANTFIQVKPKKVRDTINMLFSSPKGTDPENLKNVVRAFAKETFAEFNHRYVFVLHTDTKYPHCHVVVKAVNELGKKLDPRKAMLQQWRERYAELAREQGIEIEASYRSQRGKGYKGEKQVIRKMRDRGVTLIIDKIFKQQVREDVGKRIKGEKLKPKPWQVAQLKKHLKERQEFIDKAKQLREMAGKEGDNHRQQQLHAMAGILEKHARKMPEPKTRKQQVVERTLEKVREKDQGREI